MVSSDPDRGEQFHPETTPRRRSPARRAIAVTLCSLLLAMLGDADGLARTAERQQLGWPRSVALSVTHPLQHASHLLYLDRPRAWIADLSGHDDGTHITSTRGVRLASQTTAPATTVAGATTSTTTTTLPAYRVPSAGDPLRVLVAGDSLSDGIGISLSKALAGLPAVVDLDKHPGTGLARPDVTDWPSELAAKMDAEHPDVVVLIFGGNDAQALRTPGGWIRLSDAAAWRNEYERRVAQIMNVTARPGVSVYWIGLPVMDVASIQEQVPVINSLIQIEAQARPHRVTFVNPAPALDGPNGSYAASLPGPDGVPEKVRHDDGVHMTVAGTDRVVALFSPELIRTRHLAPGGAPTRGSGS